MHLPGAKFSFNLTREYRYKWFPWVAIIGGIVATVLVSLLSYGTSGYNLTQVASQNPNVTEQENSFLGSHLGNLLGVSQSFCTPTVLPLGSLLYTNNTALAYTLTATGHDNGTALGSLSYQNSPLQNCTIKNVQIDLLSLDRSALQLSRSQQGARLRTGVNCKTLTPQGIMNVNLSTEYQLAEDGTDPRTFFEENRTSKASVYWGERLINMYWANMVSSMYESNRESQYEKGAIILHPRKTRLPTDAAGVKSLDFFSAWCSFVPSNATIYNLGQQYCDTSSILELMASNETGNRPLPGIWNAADSLAKAMSYTVLTDLGQKGPYINILTDPDLLEHFTKNVTTIKNQKYWDQHSWIGGYLGSGPYEPARETHRPLGAHPSSLQVTYICQVPQRKPIGALIVAILVTDLVLLQTIWKIFKFVVDEYVVPRDFNMDELYFYKQQKPFTTMGIARANTVASASGEPLASIFQVTARYPKEIC
ncbi:hypothetical protein HII31_06127 [Pseudocercospora fuligena]|uniref:Uncharacterized protein n=1 Tax=Pseudocercospora fuligena TaxID=685502 RepID=A0A8H6RK64_9PEZI|nr:hypothetical protein HII31_06127 [Pseudocercospora fuligena]